MDGATPLHEAALVGWGPMIQLLIHFQAPLNAANKKGETPLIYACRAGHTEAVAILLRAGADPLLSSQNGNCLDISPPGSLIRDLVEPFFKEQASEPVPGVRREKIICARFYKDLPPWVKQQLTRMGISEEQATKHFKATIHIFRQVTGTRILLFPPLSEMGLVRRDDVYKHYRFLDQVAKGGFGAIFLAKRKRSSSIPPTERAPSLSTIPTQPTGRVTGASSTGTTTTVGGLSINPPSSVISITTPTGSATASGSGTNNSSKGQSKSSSSGSTSGSIRGVRYAIKEIKCRTSKDIKRALREVAILARVNHPNIVHFIEAFFQHNHFWLVQEFLQGGSLKAVLDHTTMEESLIAHITQKTIAALAFLHSRGFVHRDIKPSNIMLSILGEVKLIDFGLCLDVSMGPIIHRAGTCWYMPPEIILARQHSYPADIWSMGITIIEMCQNSPPFISFGEAGSLFRTATGEMPVLKNPAMYSAGLSDFLSQCLQFDPEQRTPAHRLLRNSWLVNTACSMSVVEDLVQRIFVTTALSSAITGISTGRR